MSIQRRPIGEVIAFYKGGIETIKLIKKTGTSEQDINTTLKVLEAMLESAQKQNEIITGR